MATRGVRPKGRGNLVRHCEEWAGQSVGGPIAQTDTRHPGLDPGSRFFFMGPMDREVSGGWVYIMADRYRGTMYVGVTADLPRRIMQHREGTGSDFCVRYGLARLAWDERLGSNEDAIAIGRGAGRERVGPYVEMSGVT